MRKLIRVVMFTVSIACATVSARAATDRFTSISPDGATISAIVIDPVKPSTIYAGTGHAGAFKSLDGGESWTLVFDLETIREHPATERHIDRLAIDPVRSSTVYATIEKYLPGSYQATGEIAKTVDGGATWSVLSGWREREPVIDLVIDPSNPDTLYALTSISLLQSTDGGVSWSSKNAGLQAIFGRNHLSLAVDPSLPSRVYLGTRSGLYVSNDRGGAWQLVRFGTDFRSIVVDPADSATLYAAALGGLISSRDSGMTWTTLPNVGFRQIVPDPLSSAVYAVGADRSTGGDRIGILLSTDRGQTWIPLPGTPLFPALLAVDPGSSRVFYAAGHGDLFKSENRGESWRPIHRGLTAPYVADIAPDPAGSMTLFAGTQRGVLKTYDGGQNWRTVNPDLPQAQLSINSQKLPTIFAYGFQAANRSTDGGETWTAINPRRDFRGIAVDPSDSANVYGVLYDSLARSRDGGATWTSVGAGQLPLAYYGFEGGAIAVDPVTPSNVYAAGSGGIVKSVDAGTTWKTLFRSGSVWGEHFRKLLIDPATPSTVYAITSNALYRSFDEGNTWNVAYSKFQLGTYFRDLELDPLQPSRLYLATSTGLLKSENGGDVWTEFNEGLPTPSVTAVSVDLHGNVYAGTPRGLFINSPRPDSASSPSISFRTFAGNYVSASNCGGSSVNANAMEAGPCERFTVYDLNGGPLKDGDKIHLRAANGHFVAAENGGSVDGSAAPVNANRRLPAAWETFVIRRKGVGSAIVSGDSISLQSVNGAYIAAESGGASSCDCDSRLNANRFEPQEWETFVIEMR